ncbi:MAG: 1-(5-phosphoribosyl)-5-[(5-phosphoribosylamino)methylideneamino]imidazole-4-carboxamide isomerase [Candidatus Marinimicrobia bacterium]|nr:1-(5-phosphoribosyl)-5-[(5-phosphoribosylamino)methylideneamino]imidazole-4-carboxamide isomerase [Candidatus Neomarinimicrobiota bacterium]
MAGFKVIPAIDIMDGRCMRLTRGDYRQSKQYSLSPEEQARRFLAAGLDWLHVVDLDGARAGEPRNLDTVNSIAATGIGVELGGGLRTAEHLQAALDSGAAQVILGTSLLGRAESLDAWMKQFPGRLVAGVDARAGLVAVKGWQETSDVLARDLISELEGYGFSRVIYTDIATDGALRGPNLDQLEDIARNTGMAITASGGISSAADIQAVRALEKYGVSGVIVGKAYYEGRVTLEEMVC